jgi:hypothetical protein
MPDQLTLSPWIIPIITAILGFVSAFTIERYKNRLIVLRFRKNLFQLATSTQHKLWGNIEVSYNNRKTNHLSLITYEIRNDSKIDLENVNVDFWVDDNSQILAYQSNYLETGNSISLESQYTALLQKVIDAYNANPQINTSEYLSNSQYVFTNKKFILPVYNRGTSTKFQLLVENFQGRIPEITISILHKGCLLVSEEEEALKTQKKNKELGVTWLIFFGVCVTLMYLYVDNLLIIWIGVLAYVTVFVSPLVVTILKSIQKIWR